MLLVLHSGASKLGSFPPTVRRESIISLLGVFASAIFLLLSVGTIKEKEMSS